MPDRLESLAGDCGVDAPRFSVEELVEIEQSVRDQLLAVDHSDLVPLVIDLARGYRHLLEHGFRG